MNETKKKLLDAAEALLELANAIEPQEDLTFFGTTIRPGEGWRGMLAEWEKFDLQMALLPAPFGRYGDGTPKECPAYSKCRSFWQAAQHAGKFDMSKWTGPGIQEGAAQMYNKIYPNWQEVEDAIVALGYTDWGQEWLSHVENQKITSLDYLGKWLGHIT